MSAPSLKFDKELREPTSISGRPVHKGKHLRDESPASRRSSITQETPQKHVKMARKVIDGKIVLVREAMGHGVLKSNVASVLLVIVEELHKASESGSHERRIVAITNACAEFDHPDDVKHNVELQNGAAKVLSKILSSIEDEDEIRMVCAAIEMVFRAQMTYVHVAFDKCGSVMVPNLLRIIERAESGNMKHAGTIL